jgi:DsbC/DsbD-like thiol-disulfide interchange protein
MNRKLWFLLLAAISILSSNVLLGDMYRKEEPVKIEFSAAPSASPGSQIETSLELYVEQGYHLFSNKPEVSGIRATVVQLDASDKFDLVKIDYPKPEFVYSEIFQRKLGFYQGKVVIPVHLTLKNNVQDTVSISGKIQFQTCSDKVCFPPKSHPFSAIQKISGTN